MNQRPSKDEYYLNIAKEVASRATCFRNRTGAIIVRGDQIVSTGYVGAPRGAKDCFERGECLRDKLGIPHGKNYEICRSVHSEQNALLNAARAGVSVFGGDIYTYGENPKDGSQRDSFPCFICKKMIINAGLNRVICSVSGGGVKIFKVEDWVRDWQEKDITDDKEQFGKDLNKEEGYEE
jgi:dCMP deaminase